MRTRLFLATTTFHGSWPGSSVPDDHVAQVALKARYPDRTGFPKMPSKLAMSGITYAQSADKSFVSRRRSKFAGHTPLCRAYIAFRF